MPDTAAHPRLTVRQVGSCGVGDWRADELVGLDLPPVRLRSAHGTYIDLAELAAGTLILYCFSSVDGDGWVEQTRSFVAHCLELVALGVTVVGVSTRVPEMHQWFIRREGIPFALLSDECLALAHTLGLPTASRGRERTYQTLALLASEGQITSIFYPVESPADNVADIVSRLRHGQAGRAWRDGTA